MASCLMDVCWSERAGWLRIVATDGRLSEPLANMAEVYRNQLPHLHQACFDPSLAPRLEFTP